MMRPYVCMVLGLALIAYGVTRDPGLITFYLPGMALAVYGLELRRERDRARRRPGYVHRTSNGRDR